MNNTYLADQAMDRLLSDYEFSTVLDVGSGQGLHAQVFRQALKSVTTLDASDHWGEPDILADFCTHEFTQPFDVVWCSHVLEHQPNVQVFIKQAYRALKTGGILAITVPPAKSQIVGGHVSIWNAGLLLYNLILAGFDCREARVGHYGYNISILVRKSFAPLPALHMDAGDIEKLSAYFPESLQAVQDFNGNLADINWHPQADRRPIAGPALTHTALTIEHFKQLAECHQDDRANLLWSLDCAELAGEVAEFGVFKGASLEAMSCRKPLRFYHGFDSFVGLPEAWERSSSSTYDAGHFSTRHLPEFTHNTVRLYPGFFETTLPTWVAALQEPLALVHLDADLYSSTVQVLESLNPWIVPGTILVFDELADWQDSGVYPNWPEGEWKALLEWMEKYQRTIRVLSRGARFSASVVVVR